MRLFDESLHSHNGVTNTSCLMTTVDIQCTRYAHVYSHGESSKTLFWEVAW